ncbi:unnamed protein product [Closterium sp. Naga37s-1]|nr:unnamed protein product [Closterium sp. Naga37s-1]
MPPPFNSGTTKLDTLFSVGEERTVVLAIDTCKSCLTAFDSLAASCHKTQSFLPANLAASEEFQLKSTDRLVVVFHHANHTPISIMTHLPRHQLWRPQLNPSNVVRQMQEAGRADAASVVVMALMEEREVRRALAERTAWDRRTKRAVMRMAAVARVCKIRFEAIDLSDIAGETDGSKKRETNPAPSTQSPPSESPRKTSEKSPPSQALSWEAKAEAVIRFCRHINAELLLLPSSHACKALNFSGKFASHNFTIRCARDAPCPLIKLGADLGGDRKDGRTRSCIGHRSVTVKDSQVPRSATVDDIAM